MSRRKNGVPVERLIVDRAGLAQMLGGISVATLDRLERNDPDFPVTFALTATASPGASKFVTVEDARAYVARKRAAATPKSAVTASFPAATAPPPVVRKRRRTRFLETAAGN